MGRNSEQPESGDRGTAPDRADLHLKDNTEHEAVSEDNSDAAFSVLEEAKSRINEYSEKEFGDEADFSDLTHVSLAYTTDEESFIPIEVYADLVDFRMITLYGEDIVSEKKYDTLEAMLGTLGNLEFDELVALSDEEKNISADKIEAVLPEEIFTEKEMLDIVGMYRHIGTSKQEVLEYFLENDNAAERAEYLKSIYNDDYTEFSICCPFHKDDSPSMKLYDDHFYCFGCGEHGDVIDFVSKLFSLSPKETAERLAHDFDISYDSNDPIDTSKYRKDSILRKIRASQEKDKENHVYNVLSSYFRLLQDWKRDYAPSSPDDKVDPRFVEALTKSAYVEHLLERMIAGSKEKIITDREIVRIEKVVKKHAKRLSENQLL